MEAVTFEGMFVSTISVGKIGFRTNVFLCREMTMIIVQGSLKWEIFIISICKINTFVKTKTKQSIYMEKLLWYQKLIL